MIPPSWDDDLRQLWRTERICSRSAESIKKSDIVGWLAEQSEARHWAASSRNRWQATFSLIFRVGIDNEKIDRNPATRIRRKTEGGRRVRFLSGGEEVRLALLSSADLGNSCLTSFYPSIPECG